MSTPPDDPLVRRRPGRFGEIHAFREIDSTNRYLLDAARSGAPDGLTAVADHQTAGRGRLGRCWEAAPRSSLLASFLVRPQKLAVEHVPLFPIAAAVALADAIECLTGVAVTLKWPNDVRCSGRKLAGVLAESLSDRGTVSAVVIGIGCNLSSGAVPADLEETAISLQQVGGNVTRDALLFELCSGFERRLDRLGAGSSHSLIDAFTARCETLGCRVRAETTDGVVEGMATAIDANGSLVVSGRRVSSGEVVHLQAEA